MKLGFCPQGNGTSIFPFNELFSEKQDVSKSVTGVDAVVFWGGTDIHASFYGQNNGRHNQQRDAEPIYRDVAEWKLMNYCRINKIPMIGVCRGAQFLTAFVGGTLIQHVNGHHQPHNITTKDGRVFSSTSCHHQMMYPYDVEHELLAWSTEQNSTVYLDGENKSIEDMYTMQEPEIVHYPQVRALCIQGHPEWATKGDVFVNYVNELIEDRLIPSMVS